MATGIKETSEIKAFLKGAIDEIMAEVKTAKRPNLMGLAFKVVGMKPLFDAAITDAAKCREELKDLDYNEFSQLLPPEDLHKAIYKALKVTLNAALK